MKTIFYFLLLVLFSVTNITAGQAQNNNYDSSSHYNYMALPARDSVWINAGTSAPGHESQTFGYWFVAPADMTITGLEVDTQAGLYASQTFQVIKINGALTLYPDSGSNFTNLFYHYYNTLWIDSTNIPVSAGDTIGILGQVATSISLSAYQTPFMTMIGHDTVMLNGLYSKDGNISANPVNWYSALPSGSRIGRIGMFYSINAAPPAGIGHLSGKNKLEIYPNPVENHLTIKGLLHPAEYSITNAIGQSLLSGKINEKQTKIDIQTLSPGMYWISLSSGTQIQHLKFIKL